MFSVAATLSGSMPVVIASMYFLASSRRRTAASRTSSEISSMASPIFQASGTDGS